MKRKKIAILGATGSIGSQSLEVIRSYPEHFEPVVLTANKNIEKLKKYAYQFEPLYISAADSKKNELLASKFKHGKTKVIPFNHIYQLIEEKRMDMVLNALVGSAGLKATLYSINSRIKLLLANKESLVVGGELIEKAFPGWQKFVVPVDSEHSALFQCLLGENKNSVDKIIITGSGGPFRNYSEKQLKKVTVEDALNHPTWQMGSKITIDSATLMNKGLEVIEAHYLFSAPYNTIKVVIHPQSIVHGMVVFSDGTIKAALSNPDMKLPIEYALFHPMRKDLLINPLSFDDLNLTFERPQIDKFPALNLALEAGKRGGIFPSVLNAANEVAVSSFLKKLISFNFIPEVISQTLKNIPWAPAYEISDIIKADSEARKIAKKFVKNNKNQVNS